MLKAYKIQVTRPNPSVFPKNSRQIPISNMQIPRINTRLMPQPIHGAIFPVKIELTVWSAIKCNGG